MKRCCTLFALLVLSCSMAALSGCTSLDAAGQAASGMTDEDYQTAVKVHQRLQNDPVTSRSEISVSARGGVVTLNGWVESLHVRTRAVSIARGTFGVQAVVDRMAH